MALSRIDHTIADRMFKRSKLWIVPPMKTLGFDPFPHALNRIEGVNKSVAQ